jgi:hypothetical protein
MIEMGWNRVRKTFKLKSESPKTQYSKKFCLWQPVLTKIKISKPTIEGRRGGE